jgi:HK97 family phage major capsid protein
MVLDLLDTQIIAGDGTGQNLTGILETATINSENAGGHALPHDGVLFGATKIRNVGHAEPDLLFTHPNDWRDFRLTRDSAGNYLGPNVFGNVRGLPLPTGQVESMWNIPAAPTTAISEGTALVGALGMSATLYVRSGLDIEMTDSDQADFVANLVTFRATVRAALAVEKPAGFCEITNIA